MAREHIRVIDRLYARDDLPAELEPRYQNYVIQTLTGLGLQIFVTSIAAGDIKFETSPAAKMFHVEQGRVRELL